MNILVIGGGGREHALAWKLAQSASVETVYVAPGNAGTAMEAKLQNIAVSPMDFSAQIAFIEANDISLTVVGPEQPLVDGIVDYYTERGHRCFGPSKAASQLEGSKSFTKDFLARNNIPTAGYEVFTDVDKAQAYLARNELPIVIKADGLAAGKGVVIAETLDEANSTVADMLAGNSFGDAGRRVVIEEFMRGEEASFIAIVDGTIILPMATSQDHKAAYDGDKGPNTGGMGAYSPAPVVTPEIHDRIMKTVMQPTVDAMAKEGNRYRGFLYAGLMIDAEGNSKVVEFNCRFGDPETQPILIRMQSDFSVLINAAIDGRLASQSIDWDPRAAVGVVMAAGGYPGDYSKGLRIDGLDQVSDSTKVFHAGTQERDGEILTSGGRVLCVTALGETVAVAQKHCYEDAASIRWKGAFFRKDIAYRAIERELSSVSVS